jgi:hypothetical protein
MDLPPKAQADTITLSGSKAEIRPRLGKNATKRRRFLSGAPPLEWLT